jgi:uncharacterized protein
MRFEWDPAKDRANRIKHGVSFSEAAELLASDLDCAVLFDEAHSDEEDRFLYVGPTRRGLLVVACTEPEEGVLRIVSARRATRSERERFRRYGRGQHEG